MEVDGLVPILVRKDPFERTVGSRALDEHGVVPDLSLPLYQEPVTIPWE